MKIGIGIITYNRISCLAQTIQSIFATDSHLLAKIVVADDYSTDGTRQWLQTQPRILSVLGTRNAGVARNSNRVLKYLQDVDFGFLINDDIYFKKSGWVNAYVEAMTYTPYKHYCFMCGENGIGFVNTQQFNNIKVSYHNKVMGSFLTFNKEVLTQVGGFDCHFGKYGLEHSEWTRRISLAGLSHYFDDEGKTAQQIKTVDLANSLDYIGDISATSVFSDDQKRNYIQEAAKIANTLRAKQQPLFRPFITDEVG